MQDSSTVQKKYFIQISHANELELLNIHNFMVILVPSYVIEDVSLLRECTYLGVIFEETGVYPFTYKHNCHFVDKGFVEVTPKELVETFTILSKKVSSTFTNPNLLLGVDSKQNEHYKEVGKAGTHKFSDKFNSLTEDLTAKASEGSVDPVIGRQMELDLMVKCLSRYKKNNPILIGESGVGKTSIVDLLASSIVAKSSNLPDKLLNAKVISLNIGMVVSGSKYRGDMEQKITSVLDECKKHGNVVLFIDEIHMIVGEQGAKDKLDIGNMLKPYLTSGEISFIGATTYKEYKNIFEKDVALPRRFQKIEVLEPSVSDTKEILKGLACKLESYHEVSYPSDMIDIIVDKSDKYVKGMLPDKAIDVFDLVGTYVKMDKKEVVTEKDIDQVVSKLSRIPVEQISNSVTKTVTHLQSNLKSEIFGQDHVVDKVVDIIKVNRAGLADNDKPIASLLFTGSSGSGKTELTKVLGKTLGQKVLKFDMSEYSESYTVSRLVGSPAGYVGHEDGGLLTEAVINNPNSIVLLDEIEKAHPTIFTLLLQVMDNATLTDSSGRVADFRNVIFIMTTNTGAQAAEEVKNPIGFARGMDENKSEVKADALKEMFTPEFRNRLDAVCEFNNLTEETIHMIITKFIKELEYKLEDKGVKISISEEALNWLAVNGTDAEMGARPLKRLISEKVKRPLAEIILFQEEVEEVEVVLDSEEIKVISKCVEDLC